MMNTYYVGWDVGAWKCKKQKYAPSSQDCITILDSNERLLFAWMGNIQSPLGSPNALLASLMNDKDNICYLSDNNEFMNNKAVSNESMQFIIAIDAVLGMPRHALLLFNLDGKHEKICYNDCNDLIFRKTEKRSVFTRQPFSILQDSLGSQATKALTFLRHWKFKWDAVKFIWKKGEHIAFETYPSAAREGDVLRFKDSGEINYNNETIDKNEKLAKPSDFYQKNEKGQKEWTKNWKLRWSDINDSLICAKVARKWGTLIDPGDEEMACAACEGWIWLPKDKWSSETR